MEDLEQKKDSLSALTFIISLQVSFVISCYLFDYLY